MQKVKSDSLNAIIFQALSYLTTFAIGTYIVKSVSVDTYGAYAIFNIVLLSLPTLVTLNIQEYYFITIAASKTREEKLRLVGVIGFFALICNIVVAAVLIIPPIRNMVLTVLQVGHYDQAFIFLMFYIILYSIFLTYLRFFMYTHQVKAYNLLNYLNVALWILPLLFLKITVAGIFLWKTVFLVAITMIAAGVFYRSYKHIGYFYSFNTAILKKALSFGLGSYAGTAANMLLNMTDRLMLSIMLGTTAAGFYTFANLPFTILYSFVASTVFLITLPYINDLHANKDNRKYLLLHLLLKKLLIYLTPVVVFLIAFADNIIVILGKSEYLPVARAYIPLAISYIFFVLLTVPRQELYLKRRLTSLSVIYVLGLIVNVGLNIVLIPRYNYMGAIYSSLIARGLMLVLLYRSARILNFAQMKPWTIPRWAVATVIGVVVALMARSLLPVTLPIMQQAGVIAFTFVLWSVFYIVLLRLTGLLGNEEQRLLDHAVGKLYGKSGTAG